VTLDTPLGIAALDTSAKFCNCHLGRVNHVWLAPILLLHLCFAPFVNQSSVDQFVALRDSSRMTIALAAITSVGLRRISRRILARHSFSVIGLCPRLRVRRSIGFTPFRVSHRRVG
jgi:hypothetical protein